METEEKKGAPEVQQGQVSPPTSAPQLSDCAKDAQELQSACATIRAKLDNLSADTSLMNFKFKKFFVLRPGTLNQAIKDVEALVNKEEDGNVQSVWLMAEVDHWNNEKERLVLITDNTLLVFKYDFIMLLCEQIQKISLNFVDRLTHGTFNFPKRSLLKREGVGLRIDWDRLREPSFSSKWNPFSTDFPFITFTSHPVSSTNDTFASLCDLDKFREHLKAAAEKAHARNPVPGKANGVTVLNQPITIEAYVGAMSFLGNQNKLGYCMARGGVGF
ncbi:tumor protein p63-regulated gene 1 protein [Oryzias melastigma]|uniref:Tumor protein p63 regulated 1 n=1 Tax=Oryzias melastigma TaxID=30732 RepID=A0A3B3B8Z3_ORYME|nr:tumor protein p63-regulated gene 1 protein [Oryzias melastigma]XP_036067556.1 tumor protein p63-regulated gene 1 protein [Oryzias melastigma]XP_036067557.1 tumor protein p63-regulated gene 1 protein [Oryzias melastigma]